MSRKPGPKTGLPPGENARPVTFTLDEMTLRRLDVLGKGNRSAGVRLAARVAYDRYQRDDPRVTPGSSSGEPAAAPAPAAPAPAAPRA